ncbi:MAG: type II and III secretion system protein family protein [Planctomycetota bacterium]
MLEHVGQPVVLAKANPNDDGEDDYTDFAISNLSSRSEPIRKQDPPPLRVESPGDEEVSAGPVSERVRPASLPRVRLAGSAGTQLITVAVKRTQKLTFDEPIERVAIQDPDLARVRVLSPTQLVIAGETTGTTQLTVDSGGEAESFLVNVEPNLELLRDLIASVAPAADVQLRSLNGSVVLTGRVPDAETSALIEEVASAAAGNALIAHLRVAGVQQTMLRVVIAEVNKEALRELGVNWAAGASDWSRDFFFANNVGQLNPTVFGSSGLPNVLAGQQLYSVGATGNGVGTNVTFGFPRAEMQVFLNALRQNGLARTLAEPNLVAFSGQTATFLAGGEVPIPVTQGGATAGAITIKYKEFGVRLAFTPTVLGGQVIRLHVMSELSDALPSDQLAGGLPLFTFTTRRVESTIECGNGQTFVMAGLLRDNVRATVSKIPGLGDLPVLGALFSSTSYQNSETEMIVLVTPQLVEPLDPQQVLDPPGARMTHPTDFELFSLGQLEGSPCEPAPAPAFEVYEIHDEEAGSLSGPAPEPSHEMELGQLTVGERDLHGSWGFEIGDDGE